MYGNIPAKDKLLEVEMVFAENRLELGTTAKEFVLDMANHGEAWKLVSQMMTPQGDADVLADCADYVHQGQLQG